MKKLPLFLTELTEKQARHKAKNRKNGMKAMCVNPVEKKV